jgi:hypothetical protein
VCHLWDGQVKGEGRRRLCATSSTDSLDTGKISYYINDVSSNETINGVPVTEEQIAAWSVEAEAGYDVQTLKKRGRGRPGRGAEPSQVVALRLTIEELEAIDMRAAREGKTRSEIIRDAIAESAA